MFDDISAYFHENVLDTYAKYVKLKKSPKAGISNDLRAALSTASALYHFREHLPQDKRPTRAQLSRICPDYALLGDIVNVSKHGTISNNSPQITKAENLYEQIVITEYKDSKGVYRHSEKSVFALLDNGSERDLFEIITNVLNMWLQELGKLGLLKKREPIKIAKSGIPRRRKDSDRMNLSIMRGVRFNQRFKLQKYNYEKGIIEPEDLTGAEIKFNIYKPLFTMVLQIKDNKSGEEKNLEITVDEKQKKEILKMKSPEDRLRAFFKLAKEQGVVSGYQVGNTKE